MRSRLTRRFAPLIAAAAILIAGGCVNVFWKTEAIPLSIAATASRTVRSPLKVHMHDGSTVVFRTGATVGPDWIIGSGERYPLLMDIGTPVRGVRSDSVAAIEVFEGKILSAPTAFTTVAATAAGAIAMAGLAVAIFGSCPTIYVDSAGTQLLQAEGFSYAIAPMFEHRDLDGLRVSPDADGVIRLELRNEALETHFINHIELAAVTHAPGELVVTDQASRPVVLRDLRPFGPLDRARDRAGRDVRSALASRDSVLFASDSALVSRAHAGDLNDWIDIDVADAGLSDSIAVVLRLRNSLLNTVLLYDGMLGGPDAIDWLGVGLQRINTAIDLSRWYVRTMGMHASVVLPNGDSTTVRLNDVGPIAFREVAIVLPRPRSENGRARVRLRFVADNWRIDHVQLAGSVSRAKPTWLPVTRVVVPVPRGGGSAVDEPRAIAMLAETDEHYLETRPGQRLRLEFATPPAAANHEVKYLVAWQGWYREWIRGNWITEPVRTAPFVPGDEAVVVALRRWMQLQSEYEKAFYSSRIAVR
jgi:hypothetical protein